MTRARNLSEILTDTGISSSIVSFQQSGTGSSLRTAQSKLRDTVSVKDFGAVGNGTTDDSAAFQAALNTGLPVYVPETAAGYKIGATLNLNAGAVIFSDSTNTKLIGDLDPSEFMFEILGSDIEVEGFTLDFTALPSGAGAFRLRTDLASMERIFLRQLVTRGANYGIKDEISPTFLSVALQVSDIFFRLHRGPGVELVRAFAYLSFERVTVDYVGSLSKNFVAFSITGNEGSFWDKVDVTGGTVDGSTTNNIGFLFDNCIAVWINNCMADTVGSHGFYLRNNSRYFYFVNTISSLCGGHHFFLQNTNEIHMTNCVASGRLTIPGSPSVDGWRVDTSNRVMLSNCHALYQTANGFNLIAAERQTFTGCRADVCGARGLNSSGVNSALITGTCFDSNGGGNVLLSSTNMHAQSCQASSGALINISGPASA